MRTSFRSLYMHCGRVLLVGIPLLFFSSLLMVPGLNAQDRDGDGYKNDVDNCPWMVNPLQMDYNANGVGDSCEESIFFLAIPCGDLEVAKKFYSETLGCRLDNSAQEWADVDFWGNELTLHKSDHKLDNERHDVDMGNVSVPHFGVHLSRKDFDALKQRLKDSGTKYYDEPYLRFKGTKYEQETFFVKDPNENILEIKTLTSNPE